LIDNSQRGKALSRRGRRELKSLSDMLKGKKGSRGIGRVRRVHAHDRRARIIASVRAFGYGRARAPTTGRTKRKRQRSPAAVASKRIAIRVS